MFIFLRLSISFSSNSSEILLLRDHNENKAYNLLFLCNPYHQLSTIKDIVSYSLVFYFWVYICEAVCKIIDRKIYLYTLLGTPLLKEGGIWVFIIFEEWGGGSDLLHIRGGVAKIPPIFFKKRGGEVKEVFDNTWPNAILSHLTTSAAD